MHSRRFWVNLIVAGALVLQGPAFASMASEAAPAANAGTPSAEPPCHEMADAGPVDSAEQACCTADLCNCTAACGGSLALPAVGRAAVPAPAGRAVASNPGGAVIPPHPFELLRPPIDLFT